MDVLEPISNVKVFLPCTIFHGISCVLGVLETIANFKAFHPCTIFLPCYFINVVFIKVLAYFCKYSNFCMMLFFTAVIASSTSFLCGRSESRFRVCWWNKSLSSGSHSWVVFQNISQSSWSPCEILSFSSWKFTLGVWYPAILLLISRQKSLLFLVLSQPRLSLTLVRSWNLVLKVKISFITFYLTMLGAAERCAFIFRLHAMFSALFLISAKTFV